MLCIIEPNRRTASPEFFSWVRTRPLSRQSCLFRSPSFPNQKRRNQRWVEKRFGCYWQEQFNLHRENSVSDGSQCFVNNRKLKMERRRESQKSNSLTRQNNNFARASCLLCCHCTTTTWKCLISRFVKDVNKQWQNLLSLYELGYRVDRNSAPGEFACVWQSKWVGIITIETEKMWVHSSCDVFVVVSCRGILNSLIFTKAWSMQAWIPVVSSSLYFWKSVFSFRVDSGCLYTRLLSKT